jgi:hypothetical protein
VPYVHVKLRFDVVGRGGAGGNIEVATGSFSDRWKIPQPVDQQEVIWLISIIVKMAVRRVFGKKHYGIFLILSQKSK